MAKDIIVGEGPGELNMKDIFTHANSGDRILLKEVTNFHTLHNGMNVPQNSDLILKGENPDRLVCLSTGITVYGNLILKDLTIDFGVTGPAAGERIYVSGGSLTMENVTIKGSKDTISPVLVENGVFHAEASEINNLAENGYALDLQGVSACVLNNIRTNGISLNGGQLTVERSEILGGMQIKDGADFTGTDTLLDFTDSVNPRNIICTDSMMQLMDSEVRGDSQDNACRIFNSKLILNQLKLNQVRDNGFGLELNDESEASIAGSEINGLYIRQSSVQITEKSTLSGFVELFENSVFKSVHLVNRIPAPDYAMMINGGSRVEIEYFESMHPAVFKVTDSEITVHDQKLPDDDSMTADVSGHSKVTGDFKDNMAGLNDIDSDNDDEKNSDSRYENVKETLKEESSIKDAEASLDALIGLDSVKQSTRKFINLTNVNKKKEAKGIPVKKVSLHSMYLGNPGTGKTTVARLIGKLLYENSVLKKDAFVEVSRQDLVSGYIGRTAENTLEKLKEAEGGVLFVDEAYTLNASEGTANYGQEALDTILKYMEDHRDEIMIIFAGYTKEMFDFMNMNPGLKSRVPHSFDFEDYTHEELTEIGIRDLKNQHYMFDEEKYSKELIKAYRRSTDSSNARFVRNFNEKLVIEQSNRVEEEGLTEKEEFLTINETDWNHLLGNNESDGQKALNELLKELDQLVGLENVKAHVNQLVKEARANQLFESRGMTFDQSTYHMVFTGPPGTGKTTVARLISKIFCALDILSKDTLVEVDRSHLVGSYIGHSEKNTKNAIERAMGGVLFVDEAYQLNIGDSDKDFGKQVVDTFITALENHRDQFITIFAGYTEDMNHFLEVNEGLESRIPYKIEFDAYSAEDVAEIVIRSLKGKWRYNEDFLKMTVINQYENLPDNEKSNGRWARNFTQKLLMLQKNYIVSEDVPPDDFDFITDKVIYEIGQMKV